MTDSWAGSEPYCCSDACNVKALTVSDVCQRPHTFLWRRPSLPHCLRQTTAWLKTNESIYNNPPVPLFHTSMCIQIDPGVIASNMWLTIWTLTETASLACSHLNDYPSGWVIFSTSAVLLSSHTVLGEIWLCSRAASVSFCLPLCHVFFQSPVPPFFSSSCQIAETLDSWFPSVPL